MRKIFILQGLPASGKTTWAKKKCLESGGQYKRVNKDDLRAMVDAGKYSKEREKMILDLRDSCIYGFICCGHDVIVDDTNFEEKHIDQIQKVADSTDTKVEIIIKGFYEEPEVCIKRDLKRERSVGKTVIMDMYNRYLKSKVRKYEKDENLPRAIMVDMDGTLAKMKGRSPYEWQRVGEDIVNEPIAEMIAKYKKDGYKIVILTGRDGSALGLTNSWLAKNNILFDSIFIRPEGNIEKDWIIKERIFREQIEKKYNVMFVLDDRDQVVKMWRDIGLTCLQVADGDF